MMRWMIGAVMVMGWASTCFGTIIFADDFSGDLSQWTVDPEGHIGTNVCVDDGNLLVAASVDAWIYLHSLPSFTDVGRYELTWRQSHGLEKESHRGRVQMEMPGGFHMSWWDWGNAGDASFRGQSLGALANGAYTTWATFKVVIEPVGDGTHIVVYKNDELILDQTVDQAPDFTTYNKVTFQTYRTPQPTRIDDVQLTYVPEPATLGLLLVGLLGWVRTRR